MKEGVKEEGGHFQSTIILPWPQGYICLLYVKCIKELNISAKTVKLKEKKKTCKSS